MAPNYTIKIAASALFVLTAIASLPAVAQTSSKFANPTKLYVPASPARVYAGEAQINRSRRPAAQEPAGPPVPFGHKASSCTQHSCPSTEFSGRDPSRLVPVETPHVVLYSSSPETLPKKAKRVAVKPLHHAAVHGVSHERIAHKPTHKIAHASVHSAPKLRKEAPIVAKVAYQETIDCSDLRRRAQALIDAGDADKADALLKNAIEHNPSEQCPRKVASQFAVCRARKMLECDQLECAARQLREALFIVPDDPAATSLLNDTIRRSGLDPTDPSVRSGLGQCLLHSGRAPAALVEFRQSIALRNSASAQIGLSQAASKLNLRTIALSAIKQAVALQPNNYSAFRDLGFLQESAGNLPGAIGAFTQAITLNPRDPVSGQELLSLAQAAVTAQPSAGNYVSLARAYLLNGLENKAFETFQQIGGKTPAGVSFSDWLQSERNYQAQLSAAGQAHESAMAVLNDPVMRFLNEGPMPSTTGKEIASSPACNCH